MMHLTKKVSDETEFYSVYLTIMNGILGLTDLEIKVLAEFMLLKNYQERAKSFLSKEEINRVLFGAANRKIVQNRLKISQHNLNNYVKSLKDKRMLVDENGYISINSSIFLPIPEKGETIKFDLILNNVGEKQPS